MPEFRRILLVCVLPALLPAVSGNADDRARRVEKLESEGELSFDDDVRNLEFVRRDGSSS